MSALDQLEIHGRRRHHQRNEHAPQEETTRPHPLGLLPGSRGPEAEADAVVSRLSARGAGRVGLHQLLQRARHMRAGPFDHGRRPLGGAHIVPVGLRANVADGRLTWRRGRRRRDGVADAELAADEDLARDARRVEDRLELARALAEPLIVEACAAPTTS